MPMPGTVMHAANALVGNVVAAATSALAGDGEASTAIHSVRALWYSLSSQAEATAGDTLLPEATWTRLQQFVAAHGWQPLYEAFLRQQYGSWAAAVLATAGEAAASQPGSNTSAAAAAAVLQEASATLREAPASTALSALVEHLATVRPLAPGPLSSSSNSRSASVTTPSAQLALQLLQERFAQAGSPGVRQLLQQCLPAGHAGSLPPPSSPPTAVPAAAAASTAETVGASAGARAAAGGLPAPLSLPTAPSLPAAAGTVAASAGARAAAELSEFHLQLTAAGAEEAAAQLASVADRVQHLADLPPALHPLQYACTVLLLALTSLQQVFDQHKGASLSGSNGSSSGSSSGSGSVDSSDGVAGSRAAGTPPAADCTTAVQFVVDLLHRFIRRGQAPAAAAVLWHLAGCSTTVLQVPAAVAQASSDGRTTAAATAQPPAVNLVPAGSAQQRCSLLTPADAAAGGGDAGGPAALVHDSTLTHVLLGLSQHSSSMERLLGQLLVLASCPGSSQTSEPLQRLTRLLGPLLSQQGAVDYLVSERLLLQRTLPLPALHCLTQLLYRCRPVLLAEAAKQLASSWSDQRTMSSSKVSQQAFMTAALVAAIEQLPSSCLDPAAAATGSSSSSTTDPQRQHKLELTAAAGGLVSLVLTGVSNHLADPLPSLRRQGMRVGKALAAKLDSSKPLFADQDLNLDSQECWPWMDLQQLPAGLQAAAAVVQGMLQADGACNSSSSSSSDGNGSGSSSVRGSGPTAALAHSPDSSIATNGSLQSATQGTTTTTSSSSTGGSSSSQLPAAALQVESDPPPASGRDSALAKLLEQAEEPDSDDCDTDSCGQTWSNSSTPGQPKLPPVAKPAGRWGAAAGPLRGPTAHSNLNAGAMSDSGSDWEEDWGEGAAAEDAAAEEWWSADGLGLPEGKPLSLSAVAAAMRKQDDVNGVLDAVGRVEVLIRAGPDELAAYGPELARALLHCRVPEWANAEAASPEAMPEAARARALAALLVTVPEGAGDQVLKEVYSPHLDQYQRLLILDALGNAAQELADERRAPQLTTARAAAPQLLPPGTSPTLGSSNGRGQLTAATTSGSSSSSSAATPNGSSISGPSSSSSSSAATTNGSSSGGPGSSSSGARVAPGMREVSSRVWAPGSLAKQKQQQQQQGQARTFRNRFGPVALRWATGLLRECDQRRHGVDLFGRDALLLGRLLATLGTFAAAAGDTPAALPLATGVLELLRAPPVHQHQQVFVRRSALAAAAQVLTHLPPPRVAAALLGQGHHHQQQQQQQQRQDSRDTLLREQLQWLHDWAAATAEGDSDEHCRMLAAGCCVLQGKFAQEALESVERLPEAMPGLASGRLLGASSSSSRGLGTGVSVQVPSLSSLRLS